MLKIFSVLFAFLIWSYVKSDVDPFQSRTFRDIEVRFEHAQELKNNGLVILSPHDTTITSTVSGRLSNMKNIRKEGIIAKVDLRDYDEGEHSIPVNVTTIEDGVTVDNFEPRTVSLIIDRQIQEDMMVNIIVEGQPENSYVLGRIKDQEEVKVTGPKTEIDKINHLEAELDVTDLNRSTVSSAKVYAFDNENKVIDTVTFEPSNVNIEIPIFKTETVPVKLNLQGQFPEGIDSSHFTISPNSVTIRGNSAVINRIREISTEPVYVDNALGESKKVHLAIPEGVTLVDPDIEYYVRSVENPSH